MVAHRIMQVAKAAKKLSTWLHHSLKTRIYLKKVLATRIKPYRRGRMQLQALVTKLLETSFHLRLSRLLREQS